MLEYRAKLVELIYVKNHNTLIKFLTEAKEIPDFLHPYASYLIIKHLSSMMFKAEYEPDKQRWLEKDYKLITSLSVELYERNTKELKTLY